MQDVETKYRAGLAYFANDQIDTGEAMLSSAYSASKTIGECPYSQRIVQSLREHGGSLEKSLGKREAARVKYGGLTKRQAEVLRLVAEGMTNHQIGETLFISPPNVDMHVSNILAELGCRSRTEVA